MNKFQNENLYKETVENAPKQRIKKYNVHGKITAGDKQGAAEISYYECDNIKCKKIIIKSGSGK